MTKFGRTDIKRINEQNKSGLFKSKDSRKLDDRKPKLKVGCWYMGKVTGFRRNDPVVFQDSSNPVVILNGCREPVEIGQQVIYEVTKERPAVYLGDFKEFYQKVNDKLS